MFLAGWHTHEELPEFFSASDAVVLTSAREQFGQVLVEGMACGLPAVATRSLGPATIINDGHTGWLVDPDSQPALVAALTEAVQDRAERERRGELARIVARERYSWAGASEQLANLLTDIVEPGDHPRARAIHDPRSRRSPRPREPVLRRSTSDKPSFVSDGLDDCLVHHEQPGTLSVRRT